MAQPLDITQVSGGQRTTCLFPPIGPGERQETEGAASSSKAVAQPDPHSQLSVEQTDAASTSNPTVEISKTPTKIPACLGSLPTELELLIVEYTSSAVVLLKLAQVSRRFRYLIRREGVALADRILIDEYRRLSGAMTIDRKVRNLGSMSVEELVRWYVGEFGNPEMPPLGDTGFLNCLAVNWIDHRFERGIHSYHVVQAVANAIEYLLHLNISQHGVSHFPLQRCCWIEDYIPSEFDSPEAAEYIHNFWYGEVEARLENTKYHDRLITKEAWLTMVRNVAKKEIVNTYPDRQTATQLLAQFWHTFEQSFPAVNSRYDRELIQEVFRVDVVGSPLPSLVAHPNGPLKGLPLRGAGFIYVPRDAMASKLVRELSTYYYSPSCNRLDPTSPRLALLRAAFCQSVRLLPVVEGRPFFNALEPGNESPGIFDHEKDWDPHMINYYLVFT